MPKGKYFSNNTLRKSDTKINYSLELPTPEGFRDLPKKFVVKFARNKNKCSIFPKFNPSYALIIFDHSFKNVPNFILRYVLYHELGHFFYFGNGDKSEMKCDTFANYCMLLTGFNPSQCYIANNYILSNKQKHRKQLNILINKKNGRIKRETI